MNIFLGKPSQKIINFIKGRKQKKNLVLKTINGNSYCFDAKSTSINRVLNYAYAPTTEISILEPYSSIPELSDETNLASIDDIDGDISSIMYIDGCVNLTSINAKNSKYVERICVSGLSSIQFDNVELVGEFAFAANDSLVSIDMPKLISASYAFSYLPNLETINCPSLTAVGPNMIYECDNLKSFCLPNVKHLGNTAIAVCPSLSTVIIPNCESMEAGAFYDCQNLRNIVLSSVTEPPQIELYSLYSCGSKYRIYVYVKDAQMVNSFLSNWVWKSLQNDHNIIYIVSMDEWRG